MVLDLEEKVEAQLAERASERGVDAPTLAAELVREGLQQEQEKRTELMRSVRSRLPAEFWDRRATMDEATLGAREEAVRALSTFARDHNIHLPPTVTVEELIAEDRR